MNQGIILISSNLGMALEYILLLILIIGGLIFYAKSFLLGILMSFFSMGCFFMLCYALGLDYSVAIKVMLIYFVIMSVSLYAAAKTQSTGQVI